MWNATQTHNHHIPTDNDHSPLSIASPHKIQVLTVPTHQLSNKTHTLAYEIRGCMVDTPLLMYQPMQMQNHLLFWSIEFDELKKKHKAKERKNHK